MKNERAIPTKIDPNTVRIEPHPGKSESGYPTHRGRKLVMVGDEHYGLIHMEQHGGNGNSYTFQQIGGEKTGDPSPNGRHFRPVTVYGDRMERRSRDGDTRPIAVRLHEKAVELIQSGKLTSAAAQAKRVAESNRKWRESQDKIEAAENAKLEMAASDALRQLQCYTGAPGEPPAEDVARIVALMKWAQSQ